MKQLCLLVLHICILGQLIFFCYSGGDSAFHEYRYVTEEKLKKANKNIINIFFDGDNISKPDGLVCVFLYAFCQLFYTFLSPFLLKIEVIIPATSCKMLWNLANQTAASEWEGFIS